jgi:hypothetical protein
MDLNYINQHFPKFELSYEHVHHKKVPNIYLAIPQGKKYYVWFTHFEGQDVCYLLEFNKKKGVIIKFKKISVFYDRQLSYGTILYGTLVTLQNTNFFVCENILYYSGKDISKLPFKTILLHMNIMFHSKIKQIAYTEKEYIISLCMMSNDKNTLIKSINNQNYSMYGILNRCTNGTYSFMSPFNKTNNFNRTLNFRVMADINHNVYRLYYFNGNKIEFYKKTYIPDYNTSTVLNKKFRIIKENSNLDLLEESDDEDDFENINDDKYVYLDKYFNFKCYYHQKMKTWVPFEFTNENKIANYNDIKLI